MLLLAFTKIATRGRKNGSKENIAKILSSENTHSVRRLYRDPKIIYIYLYNLMSMCG